MQYRVNISCNAPVHSNTRIDWISRNISVKGKNDQRASDRQVQWRI